MCRHLGYLGPAVPVSEPITRGPHSLRVQSWAPREMRGGGTINADGFGVAWWPAQAPGDTDALDAQDVEPTRYRNAAPIWTDPAVDDVLSQIEATAVLGAVRSATVGMPVERTACAPFTSGRLAFSHNGVVPDWRAVCAAVSKEVGGVDPFELEASTDSAALWLLVRALLGRGADPSEALTEVVRRVVAERSEARANLLLGDGEQLWATTCYHSLSVLVDDTSAVVSSEPYDDDPRWQPIDDRSVVTVRPGHVAIESL